MKLVLRPAAEADLAEARGWYEERGPGLGDRFRHAIFVTLDQIREYPESAARVRGEIRRAVVARFPYSIFFLVDQDEVVVFRVLHHARHPSEWKRR